MFAPRKPAIQVGEGLFSAIGGLFRRATPFLKTAFSSGAKMVKKAATSDLAKDVGKTLSEAAGGKQYWSKLNMINILKLWLISFQMCLLMQLQMLLAVQNLET